MEQKTEIRYGKGGRRWHTRLAPPQWTYANVQTMLGEIRPAVYLNGQRGSQVTFEITPLGKSALRIADMNDNGMTCESDGGGLLDVLEAPTRWRLEHEP